MTCSLEVPELPIPLQKTLSRAAKVSYGFPIANMFEQQQPESVRNSVKQSRVPFLVVDARIHTQHELLLVGLQPENMLRQLN